MEKFIPYEKLSKKERRKIDALSRGSWGAMSPVTRKVESRKVYKRKKAGRWEDYPDVLPYLFLSFIPSSPQPTCKSPCRL